MLKITANEGYVFRRIHDQVIFGSEIYLGVDYSTGTPREDLPEYYEEIEETEETTESDDQ
jgi:phage-related protein